MANYGTKFWVAKQGTMVRGYWWKMSVMGGTLFELWTPYDLKRKEAKEALMEMGAVYENKDIDRIWKTKG